MSTANADWALEEGLILRQGPTVFRVGEKRGAKRILENSVTLERRLIEEFELLARIGHDILVVDEHAELRASTGDLFEEDDARHDMRRLPLEMASAAARGSVLITMRLIDELRNTGYTCLRPTLLLNLDFARIVAKLKPFFAEIARELGYIHPPPRPSTVYAWSLALDKAKGDPRAVMPLFSERGGRGNPRVRAGTELAIRAVLKSLKENTSARIIVSDIRTTAEDLLRAGHEREPGQVTRISRSTVDRRVHANFTPYEIACRNLGKEAADKQYRNFLGRAPTEFPLAEIQYDDKDTRIYMIDAHSHLPRGRAFMTPGIDVGTQSCAGWEISSQPRSAWSAISAMVNCTLPKDRNRPEFVHVKGDIYPYGKSVKATFDNALYNHSVQIELAGRDASITPAWARPYTPTDKESVERFNGAADREFFSKQPGYAGSKKHLELHKEGIATAVMLDSDLIPAFAQWVFDIYHHTPGPDGLTPYQRWQDGMRLVKPRLPVDIHGLELVAALRESLRLRPDGVLFCGIPYQSDHLIRLRRAVGARAYVEFRYNPNNLAYIYVFDPFTKSLFIVPANDRYLTYATGLSLYQHRLIRKAAKEKGLSNPDIAQLWVAREDLRTRTEQLRFSKKLRDRKQAARQTTPGRSDTTASEAPSNPHPSADSSSIVSDLEAHMMDIDDIDLATEEEEWRVPELI